MSAKALRRRASFFMKNDFDDDPSVMARLCAACQNEFTNGGLIK
jgi:hypothetical protein